MKGFIKYFLFTALLVCLQCFAYSQESLVVIGNAKGSPSQMQFDQLKSILRGEKQRWTDGTKVVIALMKTNTPSGINTSRKVFNMTGDQLNKYWLALVFQGKADAPTFFTSETELENFVAQTPGAIGIITQSNYNTKIILLDGKKSI